MLCQLEDEPHKKSGREKRKVSEESQAKEVNPPRSKQRKAAGFYISFFYQSIILH
jgi:hypothetical protein